VEERLSTYAMVDDLQGSYRGMEYAVLDPLTTP
jgi:hypothetical protein